MAKIKVVVVTDDIDYRVRIKNMVECDEIEMSGYADYDNGTVLKIRGLFPDVVIFGSAKNEELRFKIVQEVYLKIKGCLFIMINPVVDIDFMKKAMQSGLRMVFPETVSKTELRRALIDGFDFERQRFEKERAQGDVRCRVFSFFSGKGGVGKTTVSVNVALGLVMRGKKVLLIDGDLQFGDANLHLDIEPKDTIAELVQERTITNAQTVQGFITTHSSGLGIICAPKSPELAEYVTSKHIEAIINVMRPYYDYIIVDLPNSLNDVSIVAAENSDMLFIVCGQEISSLKNAKMCMNVLDSLQLGDKIQVIINRSYDKSMIKIKDFESLLGVKIAHVIPDDAPNMLAGLNKGTPVISIGRTPASVEFGNLCDKIVNGNI